VGYAGLASAVDPDEGGVRLVMFGAMAALLVTSLCIPAAFGDLGVIFAVAFAAVRAAQIILFVLASRGDRDFRRSVTGLAVSATVGSGGLLAGALVHGSARTLVWLAAVALDMGGPLIIPAGGWRLVPGHVAERHGLIVIVALGGGSEAGVGADVIVAAVLGVAVACAMWWMYFDVSALAAAHRFAELESVEARNRMSRDAFNYLHFPMVAAVVLVALGLKHTVAAVRTPLSWPSATALVGGAALYLLAHVAFKLRTLALLSAQRLVAALVLLGFLPLAHRVDAVVSVGVVAAVSSTLLGFETVHYAEARRAIRHAEDDEA
jgi:low temperature requirement protein LtrA